MTLEGAGRGEFAQLVADHRSVSYTHLDVYKRQDMGRAEFLDELGSLRAFTSARSTQQHDIHD